MQLLSRIIKGESIACQEDCLQLPLLVVVPKEPVRSVSPEPAVQDGEIACGSRGEEAAEVLAAARAECEDLLARTKAECEAMLAAAAEEAQKLRVEAEKAGFAAGREEGLAAADAERKNLWLEAERLLAEARQIRKEMLARVEGQVVRLAARIAGKLLQTELQQHPETVAAMVHSALTALAESGELSSACIPMMPLFAAHSLPGGRKNCRIRPSASFWKMQPYRAALAGWRQPTASLNATRRNSWRSCNKYCRM